MSSLASAYIECLEYRDIAAPPCLPPIPPTVQLPEPPSAPGLTEDQAAARVHHAVQAAEQQWLMDAAATEARRKSEITAALEAFSRERERYFQELESEVVQLALAIARKILEREASMDPTWLAALVRIALDRVSAGPAVRLRVARESVPEWQNQLESFTAKYDVELVADPELTPSDCIAETDLGRANFGFEAQLKQVEESFRDLLARRPDRP